MLKLPAGMTVIDEEAFVGIAAQAVIVPDGCREIGRRAFADCDELKYVFVSRNTVIDQTAFEGCVEHVQIIIR